MDRLVTTVLGQKVPNVFVTYLQDLAMAQRPSSEGALNGMSGGAEVRIWQSAVDVTDNALVVVDSDAISIINTGVTPNVLTAGTLTWSDREVFGVFRGLGGANRIPGEANDYLFDAVAPTLFWGYLGRYGKDAGNADPSAPANPPVPAAGTSWAVQIATGLWLYVNEGDESLRLFNNTGATLATPTLWFIASGPTGERP